MNITPTPINVKSRVLNAPVLRYGARSREPTIVSNHCYLVNGPWRINEFSAACKWFMEHVRNFLSRLSLTPYLTGIHPIGETNSSSRQSLSDAGLSSFMKTKVDSRSQLRDRWPLVLWKVLGVSVSVGQ